MNRIFSLAVIIIFFSAGCVFAFGSKQIAQAPGTPNTASAQPSVPEPTRAELVIRSLMAAYPDNIEKVEFRNDDWALFMKNRWYYFSGGRILPENMLENAANFRSHSFYSYPSELPPWKEPTPEEAARYNNWAGNRTQGPLRRSSFFLDELWQSPNRAEAERRLARITFLGKFARVHQSIQGKVAVVEAAILAAGKTEPQVQTWINGIGTLESYGWRNIAETQNRSYHSYGLALDILPRNLGNRQTYWLWTSQYRNDWYNVSYNERYHPPASVIRIFEANGFVWGGKWPMFDTMHFEYRPEILILNGLMPATN
ncbi:MAG: M15 family metallopeptidase [Treponema sp.]|nr:M15 family metallopeptidase [Treponema sp.]